MAAASRQAVAHVQHDASDRVAPAPTDRSALLLQEQREVRAHLLAGAHRGLVDRRIVREVLEHVGLRGP